MNLRIKTLFSTFTLMLAAHVASGQVAQDLTLKVSDDTGRTLVGAEAIITFRQITNNEIPHTGLTDQNGEFRASTEMSIETFLQAAMTGHYPALVRNSQSYKIPIGKATVPLVLPRVVKPIALHALRVDLKLPVPGEWLGYDLQLADWVPPHGKGRVADIRFKYRSEFKGYISDEKNQARAREISRINAERRNEVFSEEEFKKAAGHWQGELEVGFPGPKEGLIEEAARYWHYNELKLPHHAPEEGYESGKRYEAQTIGYRQPDRVVGFYLRTRVRLDTKGNILSANYAKIYEDIRFDVRFGTVSFWYYYNPAANDRNLEFDPKSNLFPREMPGANVANP